MKNDLDDIVSRVAKLEKAVFTQNKSTKHNAPPKAERGGLPDHILALRDDGFFKQPKTAQEAQVKLQPNYACAVDRVVMALFRLSKRKFLRVTSKTVGKKKQKAYVW